MSPDAHPPDDAAGAGRAGGMPTADRAALAAHLRELERLAAAGEGEAGGAGTSPELRAMLDRLREVVAALDGLLAGADAPPPGVTPGGTPGDETAGGAGGERSA